MTRPIRPHRSRGRLVRLVSTLAVAALAVVGVLVGAAPAQADVVVDQSRIQGNCYFQSLRIDADALIYLDAGDHVDVTLVVDGKEYGDGFHETSTTDNHGYSVSLGGPWFDDDAEHTAQLVVNGETVASGSFSYITSCNPQPVPATVTFGTPVCTDSAATVPIDIAHEQGVSPEFTVTTESADGTTSYKGSSHDEMGSVHFDVALAPTGATKVSVTERYRPTLTTDIDEHTYTLPTDCASSTPTPTPTPTPTSTPTPTPSPTSTPTPEPTDESTPSPSSSATTGAASVSLSTFTASAGSQLTVIGRGYVPGEAIELWLHSTPTKLATLTASADGSFSRTVTIPEGTEPGAHHIEVRAASSGTASLSLTVTGGLAVTGFDSMVTGVTGGIAMLLLVGGLSAMMVARHRRAARIE